MLGSEKPTTFLTTTDKERAKAFFRDLLGLHYISDDGFALIFEMAGGVKLRISPMPQVTPAKFTVLGWEVNDLEVKVQEMTGRGVQFQHYGFPTQAPNGIWTAPDGSKVAWFLDPDGNVLGISEHARA